MRNFQSRKLKKSYELGKFSPLFSSDFLSVQKAEKQAKEDKFSPIIFDFGPLQIKVARHFGFCKGVENAIEVAYETLTANPGKKVYMISELIHNPFVNADLRQKGLTFLKTSKGKQLVSWDEVQAEDIVITPAFGATLKDQELLRQKGAVFQEVNATCRFVENVWMRADELGKKGYTIIVHGKAKHEETQATFSHSNANAPTLILLNMEEAKEVGEMILNDDYSKFAAKYGQVASEGFNPEVDFQKVAVVNQTTMLASETLEVSTYFREVMLQKYGEENIAEHAANTRDTLCYATKNNQTATQRLLQEPADFSIIVGGRNSSNTTHLVELSELHLPTYFIRSEADLFDDGSLLHYDFRAGEEETIKDFLSKHAPVSILITSGASCPDAIVEKVIQKLASLVEGTKAVEEVILSSVSQ
ncbi:MAG: 4-hydroxy-3-methylbut-2-enyl diphosphate reductase [Bacteroidota bacterium]